ncbi:MAG TPA: hypothetical protein VKV37_01620 [Ktedonobacteraceae bacterium]|jgi:hypothetical protein|nr:hypothetical protein [Ktedonobacteraceae bacterium]
MNALTKRRYLASSIILFSIALGIVFVLLLTLSLPYSQVPPHIPITPTPGTPTPGAWLASWLLL